MSNEISSKVIVWPSAIEEQREVAEIVASHTRSNNNQHLKNQYLNEPYDSL
ncbi:hypothetical protein PHYBLDRAFT_147351 [Phycomyces blakesleeanus NRRL 1555(-)]|uniref:Uncharacterized protein n=1 Tax=Phycomyces blakesleeanus (strain ATCC 8743b / DSM 1359 / FGSC 10004 / NBRC 33097 / NRRL 1555) TaxID=763407 RepID=A0A162PP55_PHYB8|nr:hypothetical protein PHYBLDRAFT_147351 [Phycomyces blakesleeanus NRRL 1555(-)]OAD71606.1 hypothetical protein PHYBLDRAFT_147351 [Phycomyces blakesleeanus NRRL 1555(-)]|eukprot:XP_018289646.1 hypothetical protein PHYBLDRAFT_147351 [Phycomyces blakesleeanus NRRL 1555(-)]